MSFFMAGPCLASAAAMPTPVLERVGWVFLHSLWQAAAVAGALALLLACLPRTSALMVRGRYLACVTALVAVPLLAVMTATGWAPALGWAAGRLGGCAAVVGRFAPWLAPCGFAWGVGVAVGAVRMVVGWSLSHRLVAAATHDHRLDRQIDRWRAALGIRGAVRVRVSAAVTVPVLIGVARPVILWPASTFTGFAAEHVEAILVHELAHVRRHDAMVNLLQAAIETVFFHHPAVWWISMQVRDEREHCADELAVEVLGKSTAATRLQYATALVMLEERQLGRPAFAVASDGGCLVARIQRLAGITHRMPNPGRIAVAMATAVVAIACGLAGGVATRGQPTPPAALLAAGGSGAAAPFADGSGRERRRLATAPWAEPTRHADDETAATDSRRPAALAARWWPSPASHELRTGAAAVLAAVQRLNTVPVRLVGLTGLSLDVAAVMGRFRAADLELGSGGTVTPQEVRAAARHRWRRVTIGGTTLSPEMAAAIAGLSCPELDLAGVRTLSADAATALAGFRGRQLCLDGLESLSSAAARGLAAFGARTSARDWRGGTEIQLGGLKHLDAELVGAFAAYTGVLRMPGVTAIDVATAEAIARLPCAVSLPNLQHAVPAAHGPQLTRPPAMIPLGGVLHRPSRAAAALVWSADDSGSGPGS